MLLDTLPYAAQAMFNHYSRQGDALCLPIMRMQILAKIMAWVHGEAQRAAGYGSSSSGSGSGSSSPRIY
jgi:hypothetical protein